MGATDISARPLRLLVAAFGPFPGVAVNPSAHLAQALARLRRPALGAATIELDILATRWASLGPLAARLGQSAPDAVLLLGVASRRRQVCVEVRAVNAARTSADAARRHPQGRKLVAGAPATLASTAAPVPLLAALRGRKVPARLSRDAGRYLCNAAYFHALLVARAGAGRGKAPIPVVFVHLPGRSGRPRGVGPEAMARGLSALLVALAAQARARLRAGT